MTSLICQKVQGEKPVGGSWPQALELFSFSFYYYFPLPLDKENIYAPLQMGTVFLIHSRARRRLVM